MIFPSELNKPSHTVCKVCKEAIFHATSMTLSTGLDLELDNNLNPPPRPSPPLFLQTPSIQFISVSHSSPFPPDLLGAPSHWGMLFLGRQAGRQASPPAIYLSRCLTMRTRTHMWLHHLTLLDPLLSSNHRFIYPQRGAELY